MYLYSFGLTNLLELFSCALDVRNNKSDVSVVVGWLVAGTVVMGTIVTDCVGGVCAVGILVVVVVVFKFLLKLVEFPRRELACLECPPDVV